VSQRPYGFDTPPVACYNVPMHILLISGEYPPMQGGVGDYSREMARALAAQGHRVSVLTHAVLSDTKPGQEEPWHMCPGVPDWRWGCWSRILALAHDIQPDIVNIQYQAAIYDMRVPAINLLPWRWRLEKDRPPIVVTYHDLKPPYLFPKAGPLRHRAVRVLARYSTAAIVTNAEDFSAAGQWPFIAPPPAHRPPTLHEIPIGSNIAVSLPPSYRRDSWRARLGYRSQDIVWAYFGFLNESKGGETLIRALALSDPPAQLLMIGGRVGSSDPTNKAYADRVEALMADLGVADRVRWTGYVPTEHVSAALLSADVVILPYRDGISFRRGSLHAALAHGCPIISTAPRTPLAELSQGENILLVPPEMPEAIGQAAQRLHRDPELRKRIGQGASILAEQFTWVRIAERTTDEVFAPLVDARASRLS
jgi:glycosyltransferase involved in cell wall biosynthesis